MTETRLILHVKGTEAETAELPKDIVRAAISQGHLTYSQLIWSSADNAWKQVRELPDLLPSQKLAPAPSRAAAVPAPKAVEAIIPESPTSPVARATAAGTPHVRVAKAAAGTPHVRVAKAVAETPAVQAASAIPVHSTGDLVVTEAESFRPLKLICIGLGIFILLVLAGNYLLVDRPLVSNLGKTSYSNVTVYAHLGAFMQPNVLVIHIPASSAITPDDLTDFLTALARSTPESPITHDLFERVAVTSGWTAQYSFSGGGWKQLGDMQHEDEAQRKEFLMVQLDDANGQSLPKRDEIWDAFTAHFAAKP